MTVYRDYDFDLMIQIFIIHWFCFAFADACHVELMRSTCLE